MFQYKNTARLTVFHRLENQKFGQLDVSLNEQTGIWMMMHSFECELRIGLESHTCIPSRVNTNMKRSKRTRSPMMLSPDMMIVSTRVVSDFHFLNH